MAPQVKNRASRKGKSTKAAEKFAKKEEAKAEVATTTLEKSEIQSRAASSGAAATTRTLRRRSSEQAVSKILRDNFPNFTNQQTDDKVNERGNTLRQQLRLDRKNPDVKMGLKYYSSMRQVVFVDDASAHSQLRVLDSSQAIDPMVQAAIKGLESHPIDLAAMSALFCVERKFNQRMVVAVLKGLLKLRVSSSLSQLGVLIEGLRWINTNQIAKEYPSEVAICRPHFDEALAKHHEIITGACRTTKEWWVLVKDVASLAFSSTNFATCVHHEGSWSDIRSELTALVCESICGKQVFGGPYRTIEAEIMSNLVTTETKKLLGFNEVDKQVLGTMRSRFLAEAEKLGISASNAFAKTLSLPVQYRGVEVKVSCTSYSDYIASSCVALIKSVAVETGELMPCLCESDLVPKERPQVKNIIKDELLEEASLARASIKDFAAELEDLSGENIMAMLRARLALFSFKDRHIGIEEGFFAGMSGDEGQAKFKRAVLDTPPQKDKEMQWGDSRGQLERLLATPFAKFSGRGLLSQAQTILGWLRVGEAGRAPKCSSVVSDFLVQARSAMAMFCRVKNDKGEVVFGKPGVDLLFESIAAREAEGKGITLNDLKAVAIFKWLFTESQDQKHESWAEAALASKATGSVTVLPEQAAVAEPPRKRKRHSKVQQAQEAANEKVMSSYFD